MYASHKMRKGIMGEQEEKLMELGVRESNGREGCLEIRDQLWGQKDRSK